MGVRSIKQHEQQCLENWRKENEKQPKHLRQPTPTKPEEEIPFQFTEDGWIDFQGTAKAIWQSHLDELVECKRCGRTFFPDRIQKHEATCAADKINKH